ncbi:MAG: cobyrinate a,c-diamide synthase [Bacteroides sp.]
MKLKRIMIAAPKSGSGKTTITCALLQALKNEGERVVSYKCGPDYIDPLFHKKVIGVPSRNLDSFFTGEEMTREIFLKDRTEQDFAVLEGVMGLFDGLGGVSEEGSSYHIAKITKTPVILVVDAKGMGQSVIPLIAGFMAYDKERLIKGVILNRMHKPYFETIKPLIEKELNINVLGYFPDKKDLNIESRHLGLVLPDELSDIKAKLADAAEELAKTVSVEAIREIAESAEAMVGLGSRQSAQTQESIFFKTEADGFINHERPVIAVAMDEAFCFYYEDNLRMLKDFGAQIKYFSPLYDKGLPDGCDALLLGGGYPELYADKLSGNLSMRGAVKKAFDSGMPVVAECGGFMYLHSAITDKDGISYDFAGVIPAVCSYKGKAVRFGYIELKEKHANFMPDGEVIRGHEFHYYDSTNNGDDCLAVKPSTGKTYSCVIEGENYWLGFAHLYYPSNPSFAEAFVKKAAIYNRRL